jgi:cellulose synthase/poly-beta-1,6-N-acetylglucosamine synthase-like glycosyltransferase
VNIISMMDLLSWFIFLAVVPTAITALVMFVEIAAAIFAKKGAAASDTERPPIIVLVPAHDESDGILLTLNDIMKQLRRDDRLLVVADNCNDDTALIADAAGARVVERIDPQMRGKGYALDFGIRSLQDNDPKIVVVVDADCRLEAGAIDHLALTCGLTGKPVQALYLMTAPKGAAIPYRIAEFAWRIKNELRPRGMAALGWPCQLMGSGMAFPRDVIAAANLATGHLAEDLDLGLQLAAAGYAPVFCPTAVVRSEFPSTGEARARQRERWEHGHLTVLVTRAFPSIREAIYDRNWDLFFLGLDAAVPPLILLGVLISMMFVVSSLLALVGSAAPLIVNAIALTCFVSSLTLAWTKCGRDLLPVESLISLIPYITGKFSIYARAFASDKKWIRTDRSKLD